MEGTSQNGTQNVGNNKPIKEELKLLCPLSSCSWSICKVPNNLRTVNKDSYSPQIISSGPIHQKAEQVEAMKNYKLHYMQSLLARTQKEDEIFDACEKAMRDIEKDVRACYAEPIIYDKDELVKMLLLDGCFIIELFLRYYMDYLRGQNDPTFTSYWMTPTLRRDLALLENQIPFPVLDKLFDLTVRQSHLDSRLHPLPVLALCFFYEFPDTNVISEETLRLITTKKLRHLLDLIHCCFLPTSSKIKPSNTESQEAVRCATALAEARIWFERLDTQHIFDIKFENGVLKIPQFRVHDATDSLLRNLIAFEQCFPGTAQHVSSYALLMDCLIDTRKDIDLLVRKKIIYNMLGDGDCVSTLFNNICKEIVFSDFYYEGLIEQVNNFCRRLWPRYKAALRHEYFRTPWTIISFITAIGLLTLTIIQTVYTVLSYYSNR